MLRSILWAFTDNLRCATRWATCIGQAIAWLFIVAGIAMAFGVQIPFFGSGLISCLWLAFIGWFLNNAASQSCRQVVIEDTLAGVPVERVMRQDTTSVGPDMSLTQLVDDFIMRTDERAFPVIEGDKLVRMVTMEHLRNASKDEWDTTRVRQVMIPADQLNTVKPEQDVSDALNILSRQEVRQISVVENGHLVGVLRRRDIIRWLKLHLDMLSSS